MCPRLTFSCWSLTPDWTSFQQEYGAIPSGKSMTRSLLTHVVVHTRTVEHLHELFHLILTLTPSVILLFQVNSGWENLSRSLQGKGPLYGRAEFKPRFGS